MPSPETDELIQRARESIQTVEENFDLNDEDQALNMAILIELQKVNDKLQDIEVHTNNTVRQL